MYFSPKQGHWSNNYRSLRVGLNYGIIVPLLRIGLDRIPQVIWKSIIYYRQLTQKYLIKTKKMYPKEIGKEDGNVDENKSWIYTFFSKR